MRVAFTKTKHAFVDGQPAKRKIGQACKVDGYRYCFASDLNADTYDFEVAYDVIFGFREQVLQNNYVKDLEVEVDLETGHYTYRLFCNYNVKTERDWLLEVKWLVSDGYDEYYVDEPPTTEDVKVIGIEAETLDVDLEG